MTTAFPIHFQEEDGVIQVRGLPPLDGVITYGETWEEARFNAAEALTGILQVWLDQGKAIPVPAAVNESGIEMIEPDPVVIIPLQLRWAREAAGLTQGQLAQRMGVPYQSVQKLEQPGANPTIRTLNRVARALDRRLTIAI